MPSFLPNPRQNLVGLPLGPVMGQFMHPMIASYPQYPVRPVLRPTVSSNLRDVPIDRNVGTKTTPKKPMEKKEDKFLNAHDLLIAVRVESFLWLFC